MIEKEVSQHLFEKLLISLKFVFKTNKENFKKRIEIKNVNSKELGKP
tara:strand:- start:15 stop:155 length:141 start_codon:yes stop_codon:yes gene_type:complete